MGNKSSAIGLRLQINRTWDSRWFAEGKDYGRLLLEDLRIRQYIFKTLPQAAISKVVIERPAKLARISVYAARPGVIIGKKGADIDKLKKALGKMTSSEVSLNIVEIRKPEVDARLVAQGIAQQDDVVAGDQGPFQLGQHCAAEAVHAGPRVLTGCQLGQQVVPDLVVEVLVQVPGCTQCADGSDGRGFAHSLTLTPGTNTRDPGIPAHLRRCNHELRSRSWLRGSRRTRSCCWFGTVPPRQQGR